GGGHRRRARRDARCLSRAVRRWRDRRGAPHRPARLRHGRLRRRPRRRARSRRRRRHRLGGHRPHRTRLTALYPSAMKSLSLCLLLVAAACGGSRSSSETTTPVATPAPADDPSCPLLVPGTSVSVEDTDDGAALVFVTTGDPLAVRARAAALA